MTVRLAIARTLAVAWKDLTTERRSKAGFNGVVFMAAITLLMFGFALGPDPASLRAAAAGLLWLTVLLSGVLAFNRSYELEIEAGALDALLLYPGDEADLRRNSSPTRALLLSESHRPTGRA